MKTILTLAVLFGLCSPSALAREIGSGLEDYSHLGTVNVLREFSPGSTTNRVTVASTFGGLDGTRPEDTIDGSGKMFQINMGGDTAILTYTLPGLRTVSSLVLSYVNTGRSMDHAKKVRLEGSADGGATWFDLIPWWTTQLQGVFDKRFPPAKVNRLRLSLMVLPDEGDGKSYRLRVIEVHVYADPGSLPPLFGGKEAGAFNYLPDLWRAKKLTAFSSPRKEVHNNLLWVGNNYLWDNRPGHGPKDGAKVLFDAFMSDGHFGGMGESEVSHSVPGRRLYLRFDLDRAYPMNFCVIGCSLNNDGILGKYAQAEFYTANGKLDPSTLKGNTIKDITGQGWILQKAWDKDPSYLKSFQLARPGKYDQMLVVWDLYVQGTQGQRWDNLEMFGFEKPDDGGVENFKDPQK